MAVAQTGAAGDPRLRVVPAARRPVPPPSIGTRIALPDMRTIDGRVLPSSNWRGKVVLLILWASWCPFCAKVNPLVERFYRANRARGLEVLGLTIDRKVGDALAYLKRHDYSFPVAAFDEGWLGLLGKPKGLPVIWIVGRSGLLEQMEVGEIFEEDVLEFARWLS